METDVQSSDILNKANKDLKEALACFVNSVADVGALGSKIAQIKKALKTNEATTSFRALVEQYAKLKSNLDNVVKRDTDRAFETLKQLIIESAEKNLSDNQIEKLSKILADIKLDQPTHAVMVTVGKALSYFASELSELRSNSEIIVASDQVDSEEKDIVASDIYLASKRLLNQVATVTKRLSEIHPKDKVLSDLLYESFQIHNSKNIFFKSVDLLQRTTSYLEIMLQQQHCAAVETLNDIHSNIIGIFKYSSIVNRLANSSKGSSDRITTEMLSELQNLEDQAKVIDTVDGMQKHIHQSVSLMSDMMHDFVKTQTKLHRSNLKTIKHLNSRVNKASDFIIRLEKQLDNAIDTNLIDELTGVGNRRGYVQIIDQERKTWLTNQRPLALMMIDLDKFKQVNDTYGHGVGDQVLKFLSQTLKDNIRTSDYLARYGGEEFVIVLPQTNIDKAIQLAEKLRKIINNLKFEIRNNNKALKVTCSFGISAFTEQTPNTLDVFEAADKALYKAKDNGRNDIIALVDNDYTYVDKLEI